MLVAPANIQRIDDIEPFDEAEFERQKASYREALEAREQETIARCEVLDRLVAGELVLREAAEELGMSIPGVWSLKQRYVEEGRGGIVPRAPLLKLPRGRNAQHIMAEKFAAPGAREVYALRSVIAEPLFGQVKWNRAFGRFLLRGQPGCRVEWVLMLTTHNLRRLKAASGKLPRRPLLPAVSFA